MLKYEYENATVYITEPTEEQIENIRKATERFAKRLVKEGLIGNGHGRQSNRGARLANSNARQGD